MDLLVDNIIHGCWGVFIVVWLLAALFTKPTIYRESPAQRLLYAIPIVIGAYLLFNSYRLSYPFSDRILPQSGFVLMAAAILCVCGVSFCIWARVVLGRNWSGTVTLKANHELIVRGPYRLVRHPIYTGVLAMLVATVMEQGHIGGIIGLVLIFVSLWIKSSQEERLMCQQFPGQYVAYRARVKRLLPFVL